MTKFPLQIATAAVIACVCSGNAHAGIYKCVGANGNMVFSDVSCPGRGREMTEKETTPTVVEGYDTVEGAKRIQAQKDLRRAKERSMDGRTSEENINARKSPYYHSPSSSPSARQLAKDRKNEINDIRDELDSTGQ